MHLEIYTMPKQSEYDTYDVEYPDPEPVDAPTPYGELLAAALRLASDDDIIDEAAKRAGGKSPSEYVFERFAKISDSRNARWESTGSRPLSVLERAAELGGEAGEVLNVAKKLLRHELGMIGNFKPGDTSEAELKDKLEYEMGDVLVTLVNLQRKAGVDLLRGFKRAFNGKSEELGFPERV